MTDSIECSTMSSFVIVVPGAASMPMTPPRAAHARMTSSGLHLLIGQSSRAPEWLMHTGTRLCSIVSSDVRSPAWETSMSIPSAFIRSTARRPK